MYAPMEETARNAERRKIMKTYTRYRMGMMIRTRKIDGTLVYINPYHVTKMEHCYPTKEDIIGLCNETGMTFSELEPELRRTTLITLDTGENIEVEEDVVLLYKSLLLSADGEEDYKDELRERFMR